MGERAMIRFLLDDQSWKSFLVFPPTTVGELKKQIQEKLMNQNTYYIHCTIPGSPPDQLMNDSDKPYDLLKKHADNAKFKALLSPLGGQKPMPSSNPPPSTLPPKPSTPTPPVAAAKPKPVGVTEDDFDKLLDQLTEFDVSGGESEIIRFDNPASLFNTNLPTCSSCGQVIKENLLTAFGMQWHKEHLACAICKRNFKDNDVPVVEGNDGNAYCEKDYLERFAPKCSACSKAIQGQCTNAVGKQWHPACFHCATCKQPFTGAFFEHSGKAFCEKHYYDELRLNCPTCERPIIGKCVRARELRFHPQHFQCMHCKARLDDREYFFHNDKIYCKECSSVFFG